MYNLTVIVLIKTVQNLNKIPYLQSNFGKQLNINRYVEYVNNREN